MQYTTSLTDMVTNLLIQFINVPFQIAQNSLNIPYTPLMAFVLSNLKRHINDYHEKTVDMLHQKGGT